MQRIPHVRDGLREIADALIDVLPNERPRGSEPGVVVNTLWSGSDSEPLSELVAGTTPGNLDPEGPTSEFDPMFELGAELDNTLPTLGKDAAERIRQSVLIHGMDALGWYSSFHNVTPIKRKRAVA